MNSIHHGTVNVNPGYWYLCLFIIMLDPELPNGHEKKQKNFSQHLRRAKSKFVKL